MLRTCYGEVANLLPETGVMDFGLNCDAVIGCVQGRFLTVLDDIRVEH